MCPCRRLTFVFATAVASSKKFAKEALLPLDARLNSRHSCFTLLKHQPEILGTTANPCAL